MPDRLRAVIRIISDYVSSPSLKHIRLHNNIVEVAQKLLKEVDQSGGVWAKWTSERSDALKAAFPCWIPDVDLLAFLNDLPGSRITPADLRQRRKELEEHSPKFPDDDHRDACLALYRSEREAGTEMIAIIGEINDYIEREDERLRVEREAIYRQQAADHKARQEAMFLAGAETGWLTINRDLYCRVNGIAFRARQDKTVKKWSLQRVSGVEDKGEHLGFFMTRGELSKATKTISSNPKPWWR